MRLSELFAPLYSRPATVQDQSSVLDDPIEEEEDVEDEDEEEEDEDGKWPDIVQPPGTTGKTCSNCGCDSSGETTPFKKGMCDRCYGYQLKHNGKMRPPEVARIRVKPGGRCPECNVPRRDCDHEFRNGMCSPCDYQAKLSKKGKSSGGSKKRKTSEPGRASSKKRKTGTIA